MLAAMNNHFEVVSLLKNKYGLQEPTPEEVVSYICQCAIYANHTYIPVTIPTYGYVCICTSAYDNDSIVLTTVLVWLYW